MTDNGTRIPANKLGERGLTNEPLYQGEPILAVAAVDELTAAEAIEKIKIEFEHLPFVIDPLDTLRPGGPNARVGGNVWVRPAAPAAKPGQPPPPPPPIEPTSWKWTEADFADAKDGKLPMGKIPEAHVTGPDGKISSIPDPANSWHYGDIDAGFKKAALVLDETFVTPDTSHHCLETRSAMAYWQNGKVHVFTGTQSTIQTVPAIARWLNIDPESRWFSPANIPAAVSEAKSRALYRSSSRRLLSKKCNAPVMMRLTREDEMFIGRARPSMMGRMKVGLREGRPYYRARHVRRLSTTDPYDPVGDAPSSGRIVSLAYQPETCVSRA